MAALGVWLYGALSLIFLFIAGIKYDIPYVVELSIFSAGMAYAAEFLNHFMQTANDYKMHKLQWMCVGFSAFSGVLAFLMLGLRI